MIHTVQNFITLGQNFLLVDLQTLKKKSSENDQSTGHFQKKL